MMGVWGVLNWKSNVDMCVFVTVIYFLNIMIKKMLPNFWNRIYFMKWLEASKNTECRYNSLFLIKNDIYCCSYHSKIWLLKVHDAYKLEQKRTNYGVNDLWSIFPKLTSSITFFIFLFVVPINQIISRNQDTHYSSSSFVVLTNL